MLTIAAVGLCALGLVWSGDGAGSTVTLSVPRLFAPRVVGTIPIRAVTIVTADETTTPREVDATLDAAALTTHDARLDADMRSSRFFDVARFPTISFVSKRVAATGAGTFRIDGSLTMRGITRPLTLTARRAAADGDGAEHARYEASGRFRRSEFGMTYAPGIVGNVVSLAIVVEVTRARR